MTLPAQEEIDDDLVLVGPLFDKTRKELTELKSKIQRIKDVVPNGVSTSAITGGSSHSNENNIITKHAFFDIDKTLTKGPPGDIDHNVIREFKKLHRSSVCIYFATGRAMSDVKKLIRILPVQDKAVAENGGLILADGEVTHPHGDNSIPHEFVNFLKNEGYVPKPDPNQAGRRTEFVLKKNSISRIEIDAENRIFHKKTGNKVTILESENAYHITNSGVDKGSGVNHLLAEYIRPSDYEETISIGDSELDVPMFRVTQKSYLMGDATKEARKKSPKKTKKLRGDYRSCLQKIYADLATF